MRKFGLIAFGIISACNQPDASNTAAEANTYDQQLKALSVPARNLGLRNAILDSGLKCARVYRSQYQQQYKNTAMWVARCADTGDFAIFVGTKGYGEVLRCADLPASVPTCRLPIDPG